MSIKIFLIFTWGKNFWRLIEVRGDFSYCSFNLSKKLYLIYFCRHFVTNKNWYLNLYSNLKAVNIYFHGILSETKNVIYIYNTFVLIFQLSRIQNIFFRMLAQIVASHIVVSASSINVMFLKSDWRRSVVDVLVKWIQILQLIIPQFHRVNK